MNASADKESAHSILHNPQSTFAWIEQRFHDT